MDKNSLGSLGLAYIRFSPQSLYLRHVRLDMTPTLGLSAPLATTLCILLSLLACLWVDYLRHCNIQEPIHISESEGEIGIRFSKVRASLFLLTLFNFKNMQGDDLLYEYPFWVDMLQNCRYLEHTLDHFLVDSQNHTLYDLSRLQEGVCCFCMLKLEEKKIRKKILQNFGSKTLTRQKIVQNVNPIINLCLIRWVVPDQRALFHIWGQRSKAQSRVRPNQRIAQLPSRIILTNCC